MAYEIPLSMIQVRDKTFRPFISHDDVMEMVDDIATRINHDYAGRELTMLVILQGAMVYAADLMRRLRIPVTVETIRASSYRDAMTSNGTVTLEDVVPDLYGRDVLIVEDIVDSGNTIEELVKHLAGYEPASIALTALLSKPEVHQGRVQIDYLGREIAPDFVVGYGLDYAGHGRNLNGIWIVEQEE